MFPCWSWSVLVAFVIVAVHPLQAQEWRTPQSRDRSQEFVGFVETDRLYWRPYVMPGVQRAEFKLLSMDESTGARTQLVRLPPGWTQNLGFHTAKLEIFVLEGGVTTNAGPLYRYSYAYYPAGHVYSMQTEGGATILQWWGGSPDYRPGQESNPERQTDHAIEQWHYGDAPFLSPTRFPKFRAEPVRENSPLQMKLLRTDSETGQMTWIVMIPGGGPALAGEGSLAPWASSPSWQEGFLLAGDMTVAECLPAGQLAGRYDPGDYFFRPAGIRHGGPSEYSTTFALWIFRSGAGHWVDYHDTCPPWRPIDR